MNESCVGGLPKRGWSTGRPKLGQDVGQVLRVLQIQGVLRLFRRLRPKIATSIGDGMS